MIERLLQRRAWEYIEMYWKNQPTFPDPVVFENIMYSAHVAQMIALYESITGDTKYDTAGFDFVWSKDKVIHYTARKLMQVMYDQVASDPQLLNREMIVEVDQPVSGKVKLSGSVYKMSKTPGDRRKRVPEVGEHNEEIYGGLLGIDAQERQKLKEESVI